MLATIAVPATWADDFTVPPGFKVEELVSVQKETQGSWVSVCVDPKGDLIASDQYGFLWKITPPPAGQADGAKVEQVKINAGKISGSQAATDLQATMVKYAKSQGFTVK